MDEVFIISSIINKLLLSQRDIRHALKLKKEEIILSNLGQRLVIESSIRIQENRTDENPNVGTINMVAEGKPFYSGEKRKKNASFKGKATSYNAGEKACRECGKPKHQKKNFFVFKNKQKKAKGGRASTSKDPPNQG